ncbi:ribonuclease Z [Saccharopolyspora subtropica]|uniref:Ribonuclease Z n=1 Tax=Saccharopolyspora thermophila TaxID=89367 RepID=A0A917JW16_9PSEU|nr:ribonuclease Z [Saccharopolyspora subtropica]GGI89743.1 ribonuclease Z [Saccharopolyspora subtropica]
MANRELVVLGTASQAPTRTRNHNGYLLRWDGTGFLFDPGEGTQRQMIHARVSAHDIDHLCLTHFHGDHCLGVPGVVQRLSLDRVPHPVQAHFPAAGQRFFQRLRYATAFEEVAELRERPIKRSGPIATGPFGTLHAVELDHRIETFGYRLVEPDGRRLLPDRLAALGISGPDVGRLQREGALRVNGRLVTVSEVSEHRPGQRFGFAMDTRLCDGLFAIAEGADLLVVESTFLEEDARLADEYRHLTAAQAARVAAESGVRCLVLTHFSQRYTDPRRFHDEAAAIFSGQLVVAADLTVVPVPPRTENDYRYH